MKKSSGMSATGVTALNRLRSMVTDDAKAIELACIWEASAPKLGNVHPHASFDDCDFNDFCAAATLIAPLLGGDSDKSERAPRSGLGDRILAAITATRTVARSNVNLGIVLLIAPLALARSRSDIATVLANLTPEDGAKVYRAIELAGAGGLDSQDVDPQWDVSTGDHQCVDLAAAMRQASGRDRIARQYANNFSDFFENVVPVLAIELDGHHDITEAIVRAQLRLLAAEPDSLIERKCGAEIAAQVTCAATACLPTNGHWDLAQRASLDQWLREDGNRRNPGTTADLIAAALYWLIR
jgi:triphosphoribosyl-dephospho-CoA synthase